MARLIGPLPASAWAILGLGALGIWLAGRDMNTSSTATVATGAPVFPFNPFAPGFAGSGFGLGGFGRFGRPDRNFAPPPGQPGSPQGPLPQMPPGTAEPPTGHLPTVDSAAPPTVNTSVTSTSVEQPGPHVTYVTAGESDNLYTMSVRNYSTPLRYVDIFNANRTGTIRADGSPGVLAAPDFIEPGTRIIIP